MKIDEVIVVEGRDDVDAVGKAVEAEIIATHGYGITKETWLLLEKAAAEKGLIVFTDPDHAGEEIRKKIDETELTLAEERRGKERRHRDRERVARSDKERARKSEGDNQRGGRSGRTGRVHE